MSACTPPLSQEANENEPPSSPLTAGLLLYPSHDTSPVLPSYNTKLHESRPKKPPTITPRSFTRFFTPKSLSTQGNVRASRKALRHISASSANSRAGRPFMSASLSYDKYASTGTHAAKRRRLRPISPAPSPDLSSPIRRIHNQSLDMDQKSMNNDELSQSESAGDEETEPSRNTQRARIGPLGYHLSREVYSEVSINGRMNTRFAPDCSWQMETSNFHTRPDDNYVNMHTEYQQRSIPFCAVPCNTNSLIALGDEDGGVRLLESGDVKPAWSTPHLTFRPHSNAILDLSFTLDDMLLATASGDQTTKIIDMPTQTTIHTLAGHYSSVKQARFQPESSNILASSSRDGSVQLWDLRCKGIDGPVYQLRAVMDPTTLGEPASSISYLRSVNAMFNAHRARQPLPKHPESAIKGIQTPQKGLTDFDAPSKSESPGRRSDISVTCLAFLPDRPHLLLTGCEADAAVKLWDIRTTHNHRRGHCTPLSTAHQPDSHNKYRQFGLTSMSLSSDGGRLYTLCRDNTVYAYATSHLVLGHCPELSVTSKPRRAAGGREKEGLGPLYGLRHPKLHATTFYVKTAIRQPRDNDTELLAVGSSDGCPVIFPTNERYLYRFDRDTDVFGLQHRSRPSLARQPSFLSSRLEDTIPIYDCGTPLVGGHSQEVTAVTWSHEGKLVSLSDDCRVRLWREGGEARELRVGGEGEGRRWECGWAEVTEGWDDSDDE